MKTYQSFKATENSNRIVSELNAVVLSATFENKKGEQLADVYGRYIVSHGHCGPVNETFTETVKITFN